MLHFFKLFQFMCTRNFISFSSVYSHKKVSYQKVWKVYCEDEMKCEALRPKHHCARSYTFFSSLDRIIFKNFMPLCHWISLSSSVNREPGSKPCGSGSIPDWGTISKHHCARSYTILHKDHLAKYLGPPYYYREWHKYGVMLFSDKVAWSLHLRVATPQFCQF